MLLSSNWPTSLPDEYCCCVVCIDENVLSVDLGRYGIEVVEERI